MNGLPTRLRSERGSLPLVLLAVIVVAGLSSVLLARVTAEIRAVTFDENYTVAAHVADAGVQEAIFLLNNQLITETSTCAPPAGDGSTQGVACGSGSVDGEPYEWVATFDSASREWEVSSNGSRNDRVDRTLTAVVSEQPLFGVAAFSEHGMTFNGGNSADSYNSVLGTKCSLGKQPDPECFGIIASNEDLDIKGNNSIDQVQIWNWAARPDGGGITRCSAQGNSSHFCNPPHRRNFDEYFEISPTIPIIQAEVDSCAPGDWKTWKASNVGTGTVTFPFDGGKHCFDSLIFDRDTILRPTVTVANPLRIYMRDVGRLEVDSHRKVNIRNCTGSGTDMPCSPRLQIYSLATDGVSTEAVRIQNHAEIALGLFVPQGSCGILQGSNAQADIYGSMICQDIRNQGGWGFHYDEALAGAAGDGIFRMSRLDER